jgi:hypothetical protein
MLWGSRKMATDGEAFHVNRTQEVAGSSPASSTRRSKSASAARRHDDFERLSLLRQTVVSRGRACRPRPCSALPWCQVLRATKLRPRLWHLRRLRRRGAEAADVTVSRAHLLGLARRHRSDPGLSGAETARVSLKRVQGGREENAHPRRLCRAGGDAWRPTGWRATPADSLNIDAVRVIFLRSGRAEGRSLRTF